MKHPFTSRSPRHGFALVSTLAVVLIVSIILVAYSTVMRTERAASQNFTDHDRAESVALGMLNRILVDHATASNEDRPAIPPFEVDPSDTTLPTKDAAKDYYNATLDGDGNPIIPILTNVADRKKLRPIYQMVPDDEAIFAETGLVRTSKATSGTGDQAYNEDYWAYDGLTEKVLGSPDAQPRVVPQWVDYYETDPKTGKPMTYPSAQIAFAIWDEGGKFDINMAGKDGYKNDKPAPDSEKKVNGFAPYDLMLDQELSSNPQGLLAYLDGENTFRERNNFSLRQIVSKVLDSAAIKNDKGDDRWLFSVRELVEKGFLKENNSLGLPAFRDVTTMSRDFDVRPEWDGDRRPLSIRMKQGDTSAKVGSEDYLRSFINNPNLFSMFYGAGQAGPKLVSSTLNQLKLQQTLNTNGSGLIPSPSQAANKPDWMQVMRLLAILRRALPPYRDLPNNITTGIFDPKNWDSSDIWATALNVMQASAPPSDHNLLAVDTKAQPNYPYADPGARVGTRISPLITEFAVKLTADPADGNKFIITEYIEIWNPYPFKLKNPDGSDAKYRVGVFAGSSWPGNGPSYGLDIAQPNRVEGVTAPGPGEFKVIRIKPRSVSRSDLTKQVAAPTASASDFRMRMRPYLQDMEYYSFYNQNKSGTSPESVYYALSFPSFYNAGNQLVAVIPGGPPAAGAGAKWFSFQIDDPRMGSLPLKVATTDGNQAIQNKETWVGYANMGHTMAGTTVVQGNDSTHTPVTPDPQDAELAAGFSGGKPFMGQNGYNRNFGANWPGAPASGITTNEDFAKLMSTFGLPGRPLLNVGELGTVFAFRPWTTLNFANMIVPKAMGTTGLAMAPQNNMALRPAAFLDYYTTLGTTTTDKNLNYMPTSKSRGNPGVALTPTEIRTKILNMGKRYQDKAWLFESVNVSPGEKTDPPGYKIQTPTGNLRAIRGRINLNTASESVLTILLKAPYRMPASLGLKQAFSGSDLKTVDGTSTDSGADYLVTIDETFARKLAQAITLPIEDPKGIRPLRTLSDLSQLYDNNEDVMRELHDKYPPSVVSAMIGRLAQFGTVRSQAYTIDLAARSLAVPKDPKLRASSTKPVVTGEVRVQARVFFDSFSRKAFIESIQYR
jgi:type II secretory pathway pseudopilin PulG